MKTDETKTSQDVKTGLQIEADKPSADRRSHEKDDASSLDVDETFPEHKKQAQPGETKQADQTVQGKNLEEKPRGGDTADV